MARNWASARAWNSLSFIWGCPIAFKRMSAIIEGQFAFSHAIDEETHACLGLRGPAVDGVWPEGAADHAERRKEARRRSSQHQLRPNRPRNRRSMPNPECDRCPCSHLRLNERNIRINGLL